VGVVLILKVSVELDNEILFTYAKTETHGRTK